MARHAGPAYGNVIWLGPSDTDGPVTDDRAAYDVAALVLAAKGLRRDAFVVEIGYRRTNEADERADNSWGCAA